MLLDEPTAGLDVTSARTVRKLVGQLRDEGGTVIYSTHHLAEAHQVCDRIIIVHNGTIRADGSPEYLLELTGKDSLEEAYVSLTSDKARTRTEQEKKESRFAKWWRLFLTGRTPEIEGLVKMSNSWRFISTIAKKEIIEFVRDWRTLLALIVIPCLFSPHCS